MRSSPDRRFLFLQGMANGFFARLGEALAARGHEVRRINFNGGDRVFWRLPGAEDFRGGLASWPGFLSARLDAWRPTDLILFGDCRPLHEAAIPMAEQRGIAVHVFEEGYVRPNYVTMESGGVNARSSLLRDAEWFLESAEATPAWTGGEPVAGSFARRAFEDVLYNIATTALWPAYPGYRTHRPWRPLWEYVGWAPKLVRHGLARRRNLARLRAVAASPEPFFVLPLQLDSDTQIQRHSKFSGMAHLIDTVFASFAANADPAARLVVKEHPLDNGLIDWRRVVRRAAAHAGVADRVTYLEAGPVDALLDRAAGVITVNSTTGFLALAKGRPVVALGDAIYDLPGLAHQGGLAAFWRAPEPPRGDLFDAFRRVVVARTQVNGGFYSARGLGLAVRESVARLEGVAQAAEPKVAAEAPVTRPRFSGVTAPEPA